MWCLCWRNWVFIFIFTFFRLEWKVLLWYCRNKMLCRLLPVLSTLKFWNLPVCRYFQIDNNCMSDFVNSWAFLCPQKLLTVTFPITYASSGDYSDVAIKCSHVNFSSCTRTHYQQHRAVHKCSVRHVSAYVSPSLSCLSVSRTSAWFSAGCNIDPSVYVA